MLNVDIHTVSGITSHPPGYIDEENELIKGLQTDSPLKGLLFLLAVSGWLNRLAKGTDINYLLKLMKFLISSVKHIMKVYLVHIQKK